MRTQASITTYRLVCVRELAPRLGNIGEDLAVGQVRVRSLDLFADVVLVEEVGGGRTFRRVGVLGFLFFRLPLAFFTVAIDGAIVGSGGIIILVGLLGTTGPTFYGLAIGDRSWKRCRLERVRVRLGDGEDVLEVVCKSVRLVRTLAESLRGFANAGDELWRAIDATRAV